MTENIMGMLVINTPDQKVFQRIEDDGKSTYFYVERRSDGKIYIHAERETDDIYNRFVSLSVEEADFLINMADHLYKEEN